VHFSRLTTLGLSWKVYQIDKCGKTIQDERGSREEYETVLTARTARNLAAIILRHSES